MEKEKIINILEIVTTIFNKEIILTGSGALQVQGFDCKVNDLDIIVENNSDNMSQIRHLQALFPYHEYPYGIENAFKFFIGDFRIEIFLKKEEDIKKMDLIDWSKEYHRIKVHDKTQIIKTKMGYGRPKDKDFFRKHKGKVLQILLGELSKKTCINICEIRSFLDNLYIKGVQI